MYKNADLSNINSEITFYILRNSIEYSEIGKMLQFMLIIPSDTVECERMISIMNLIKTDIRNLIGDVNLNSVMNIRQNRIKLFPNRSEFLNLGIERWKEIKNRMHLK